MTDVDTAPVPAYLGLGSNLGDRVVALSSAVWRLDDVGGINVDWSCGIAPLYESPAIGGPPGQGPYLNSAVRVFTTLPADALLQVMQGIENALGRMRKARHEPRTLDIDLLLYGELICDAEFLSVPHPRMHRRRFVLEPLAAIAPSVIHPVSGKNISELLASEALVDPRPVLFSDAAWPSPHGTSIARGRVESRDFTE